MKLTLLGTGSPLPSVKRASTGHLLEVGASRIVIDVGPGAVDRLLTCSCPPVSVTQIVISHLHFDHIGDLARLLFYCWDSAGGIGTLPSIAGPPGMRRLVDALFGAEGAYRDDLTARTNHPRSLDIYTNRGGKLPRPWPSFDVSEYGDGRAIGGKGWELSCYPVLHHQPYLESFGVRVDTNEGVVAYSSDIEIAAEPRYFDSLKALAADADILVHYLNEFDFDAQGRVKSKAALMGELAARARVKVLVTTHHGPAMDKPGVRERVMTDIATTFSRRAVWGEDLSSFVVSNGQVTVSGDTRQAL